MNENERRKAQAPKILARLRKEFPDHKFEWDVEGVKDGSGSTSCDVLRLLIDGERLTPGEHPHEVIRKKKDESEEDFLMRAYLVRVRRFFKRAK